jgi:hypothetical protein
MREVKKIIFLIRLNRKYFKIIPPDFLVVRGIR